MNDDEINKIISDWSNVQGNHCGSLDILNSAEQCLYHSGLEPFLLYAEELKQRRIDHHGSLDSFADFIICPAREKAESLAKVIKWMTFKE